MNINQNPSLKRIFQFWDKREELALPYKENPAAVIHPFITIAREPGSGGAPVAKAVAHKLGFQLIDDELVEDVARSASRRKEIIKNLDEKTRSGIEDMVESIMNPEYINQTKYVTKLAEVLLSYAQQGKVVILGRGANFLMPFARGLHVNILAPYEVRVKRAMDFEGHTREKAMQVLAEVEEQRYGFVRQYLRREPKSRNAYDININTTYLDIDAVRDIILEAFYQKFSRTVKRP